MRLIDGTIRKLQNRLKIGAHFLATLPEAVCDGSNDDSDEQLNSITEVVATSRPNTPTSDTLSAEFSTSNDTYTSIKTTLPTSLESICKSPQSEKLQHVLADLKTATLSILEHLRTRLSEVVCNNLEAFAGSWTDLGRTAIVVHTIKTKDAIL